MKAKMPLPIHFPPAGSKIRIPAERNIEYLCLKFITHPVASAVYLT